VIRPDGVLERWTRGLQLPGEAVDDAEVRLSHRQTHVVARSLSARARQFRLPEGDVELAQPHPGQCHRVMSPEQQQRPAKLGCGSHQFLALASHVDKAPLQKPEIAALNLKSESRDDCIWPIAGRVKLLERLIKGGHRPGGVACLLLGKANCVASTRPADWIGHFRRQPLGFGDQRVPQPQGPLGVKASFERHEPQRPINPLAVALQQLEGSPEQLERLAVGRERRRTPASFEVVGSKLWPGRPAAVRRA
jgi:hypothetical protein